MHLVRLACELPEQAGRSLGQWDCAELARQLVIDEVVAAISPQTVQRLLAANRLKPWRSHVWLHPRTPRDAAFAAHVRAVADLLTRPLAAHELVLSLDEMTSLQPRPRRVPTRPAQSGRPVQVEHEIQAVGQNAAGQHGMDVTGIDGDVIGQEHSGHDTIITQYLRS